MTERDYRILGLTPGAGLVEIRRACERLKALYAEDSLATYSLLDPEERASRLADIESCYRQVVGERSLAPASVSPPSAADLPDPAAAPGRYLRLAREQAGISQREISVRTKVSPMTVDAIEQQQWSRLPASVYLRGFVFELARTLGLPDPREIARLYLACSPERGCEG